MKWISVKDHLPPLGAYVIVSNGNIFDVAKYDYDHSTEANYFFDDDAFPVSITVTHWCIPDLLKKGE